jgi:glutamyl-tRNA synthetase
VADEIQRQPEISGRMMRRAGADERKGMSKDLAELLFPDIDMDADAYESIYPARDLAEGAVVSRLGPSPTGFIHLGNLYGAFVNERLAHQSGGVFFLRIEDTDEKREVEGAAEALIESLQYFGIRFDEGVTADGESGIYAPYRQSERRDIYRCFVKKLVTEGKAYPCFLTEEEIAEIRASQEAEKLTPGIYGEWARYRDADFDEVKRRLENGEAFVVRFKSCARQVSEGGRVKERATDSAGNAEMAPDGGQAAETVAVCNITVMDGIRGELIMPENSMDVVILKTGGLPTYHFAHVVDDHLMRTTHVIRGEEWLSSLPVHVALFEAMGWKTPIYCHTAVLMKMEGETKRKLSKRKDPELSLAYYRSEGYHPLAVREYLLTIINSNFEEWRAENPIAPIGDFAFTTAKMSRSGTLFDLDKLRDVSKEVMLRIPACELADFIMDWAETSGRNTDELKKGGKEYLQKILDIGRSGEKPRKDLAYGSQIFEFIGYFYEGSFSITDSRPENVPAEDIAKILKEYADVYDHADDQTEWFAKVRELAVNNGYAAKPKDFKKNPEMYKGHVGDVSTVIRIAITGRASSPDLWEIQQILGEQRVKERLLKSRQISKLSIS